MNELGTAMRDVTEDVDVRVGFTADVLRGGRRRLAWRRRGFAVALAAVMGLVGFGVGMAVHAPKADERLEQATKGDLAGDAGQARDAVAVWRRTTTHLWLAERELTEFRGEPHVYWSGTTPTGAASVVMQEAKAADRWRTVVGLVATDPSDDTEKLVGSTNPADPTATSEIFQFGHWDNTFLVVDPGLPVYASPAVTRDSEDRVKRVWTRVPVVDGVAVWTASGVASTARLVASAEPPPDRVPTDLLLTTRPSRDFLADGVHARPNGAVLDGPLPWMDKSPVVDLPVGEGGTPPPRDLDLLRVLRDAGMTDSGPSAYVSSWRIYGKSPNGKDFLVFEYEDGGIRGMTYALLLRPDGSVEKVLRGPETGIVGVPIKFRLPDGQGWVVGSPLTDLRYRTTSTGEWHAVGRVALVPDDTTQVEVIRLDNGQPEAIDLPR